MSHVLCVTGSITIEQFYRAKKATPMAWYTLKTVTFPIYGSCTRLCVVVNIVKIATLNICGTCITKSITIEQFYIAEKATPMAWYIVKIVTFPIYGSFTRLCLAGYIVKITTLSICVTCTL